MIALQEGRSLELTHELLQGSIDIHVHPGPHLQLHSTCYMILNNTPQYLHILLINIDW